MRLSILLLLLATTSWNTVSANEYNFGGVWTGWQCPRGLSPESGKCANFVLELHQKQNGLCGSHLFATAGAAQVDEGAAPSIIGVTNSDIANVTVDSIVKGQPTQLKAELRLANGKLEWKRSDASESTSLLPQAMRLSRSKHGTLFHPVFEQQLKAACSSVPNSAPMPNMPTMRPGS